MPPVNSKFKIHNSKLTASTLEILSAALIAVSPAFFPKAEGAPTTAWVGALAVIFWAALAPPRRRTSGWWAWGTLLLFEAVRSAFPFSHARGWNIPALGALAAAGVAAFAIGRLRRRLAEAALDMRALARRAGDFSRDARAEGGVPEGAAFEAAEEHLSATMRLCQHALGARTAALLRFEPAEGKFSVRAHASESALFDPSASVPGDSFPVGAVRLSREPLVTAKERAASAALAYYRGREEARSVAAAPVMEGENAFWGALVADHPEAGAFAAGDRPRLAEWAAHLARTLALWRNVAASEESARELRVLLDAAKRLSPMLGAEEAARELLLLADEIAPCDAAAACLFAEGRREYRVIARQEGAFLAWEEAKTPASWARWIYENAEEHVSMDGMPSAAGRREALPLYSLREPTERVRSFFGAPLRAGGGKMGAFVAGAFREGAFPPRAAGALALLAAHAALVMEAAEVYRRMESLSVTDALTGLANRRRFHEALEGEIRRVEARATGESGRRELPGGRLSLLMLDLDHFKRLNDAHGHPAGDAVLRRAAEILKRAVRDVDLPARVGGEEFAVVLADTDAADALRAAERIRADIEDGAFSFEGNGFRVTASVGAATYPDDARSAEALAAAADRALYAAKRAGRNRSVHARSLASEGGAEGD